MKKIITILIFNLLNTISFSQPNIIWEHLIGDDQQNESPSSIDHALDGGFIVVGKEGPWNQSDGKVVKFDSDGEIQWEKSIGDDNRNSFYGVTSNQDGSYTLVGSYDADLWVVKLNDVGDLIWEETYGGSFSDYGTSIQHTIDGGYIIGGVSNSNDGDVENNYGLNDYWVIKINATGIVEWQNNYGGTRDDYLTIIYQTADGGFILGGESESNDGDIEENNGGADFWLVKIDDIGNLLWEKSFGTFKYDQFFFLDQTSDNGFIAVGALDNGTTEPFEQNFDCWVLKLDQFGNTEWENTYGGSSVDIGVFCRESSTGDYIIGAKSQSDDGNVGAAFGFYDNWIFKIDSQGNFIWSFNHGTNEPEVFAAGILTANDDIITTGVRVFFPQAKSDIQVIKLSETATNTNNIISSLMKTECYPNPSNGLIFLKFKSNFNYQVNIYAINKTLVLSKKNESTLSIQHLTPGIYTLEVTTLDTHEVFIHQFVVSK